MSRDIGSVQIEQFSITLLQNERGGTPVSVLCGDTCISGDEGGQLNQKTAKITIVYFRITTPHLDPVRRHSDLFFCEMNDLLESKQHNYHI